MNLRLPGERMIPEVWEWELRDEIDDPGNEFAVLESEDDPQTYIQFAERSVLVTEPSDATGLVVEFRDGTPESHRRAVLNCGETAGPARLLVMAAFLLYLRGDPRWRAQFEWEPYRPVDNPEAGDLAAERWVGRA